MKILVACAKLRSCLKETMLSVCGTMGLFYNWGCKCWQTHPFLIPFGMLTEQWCQQLGLCWKFSQHLCSGRMTTKHQFHGLTYLEGHLYSYLGIDSGVWNSVGCQDIVQWGLKKGKNFIPERRVPGPLFQRRSPLSLSFPWYGQKPLSLSFPWYGMVWGTHAYRG